MMLPDDQVRVVGPVAAGAAVVGSMIGTGVFTSLGFQLFGLSSGFPLLLLWVIGGVYALFGALCYAELAAALPRSGGEYHLLGRVFHPAVGFMAGWLSMTVGFAAPVALAAIAFGSYVHGVFGGLDARWLALLVVAGVTCLHLWKVRVGARLQSVTTVAKVALIVVLIVAAFAVDHPQPVAFLPAPGDWRQIASADFAVSLVFVTYAYSGWNAVAYIAGELRDPQRNVPRALLGGTLAVTALYVLVNAGFLHSTPMAAMTGEPEVALVAAKSIFGEGGGNVMGLLIAFGLISTVSAMTWTGPRVAMVAGQDYRALRWLGRRSAGGVPVAAVLVQCAITLGLLVGGGFATLLIYIELALMASTTVTACGVLRLRRREPELPRPFRLPCAPFVVGVFVACNGYIAWHTVTGENAREALLGLGTLALGLAMHWLLKSRGMAGDRE